MSAITPNETARSWKATPREQSVHLFVGGVEGDAGALVGARVAGFPLALTIVPSGDAIDPHALSGCAAAVVQVDQDNPESMRRFQQLAQEIDLPLIAAAYEPPLSLVRSLNRAGAYDVIPLPLTLDELETALAPLRDDLSKRQAITEVGKGKLVTIVKSEGGVGATALLGQLAVRFAANEAVHNREACLIDLDVQFGDATFQLGLQPMLSLFDLLEAGTRLDGDLFRATTTPHASGLKVVAAPFEMMPLESVSSEQVMRDRRAREARVWDGLRRSSDELDQLVAVRCSPVGHRAAGHRDEREWASSRPAPARSVCDRRTSIRSTSASSSTGSKRGLLRTVRPADVKKALGRDVGLHHRERTSSCARRSTAGVPIEDIKRKSAARQGLDKLDAGIAAALGGSAKMWQVRKKARARPRHEEHRQRARRRASAGHRR